MQFCNFLPLLTKRSHELLSSPYLHSLRNYRFYSEGAIRLWKSCPGNGENKYPDNIQIGNK